MKQQPDQNKLDAPWLEQMRQEMSDCTDFGTTLPDDGWEKIAAKVNGPSITSATHEKKNRKAIVWWSSAACALLLVGLTTSYLMSGDDNSAPLIAEAETPAPVVSEPTPEPPLIASEIPQPQETRIRKASQPKPQEVVREEKGIVKETVKEAVKETVVETVKEEEEIPQQPSEEEIQQKMEDFEHQLRQAEEKVLLAMEEKETKPTEHAWNIGLGMDGGGLFDANDLSETGNQMVRYESILSTRASSADNAGPQPKRRRSPTDIYSSENHRAYSFGATVSYNITPRLAVQSGIVATTLVSDLTLCNKQKLHQRIQYLGLPLQLNCSLYENQHWQFYTSGGGRFDQGIQCKRDGKSLSYKSQQWSVAVAGGVQYKFYRNLGIYIEPNCAYYFDNGTSENFPTQFTEHPLSFNLQAGIRINFNK